MPGCVADVLPGVAAVSGTPQSAVRATAVDRPERAAGLPDGGEDDARVVGVQRHVDGAGAVADVQHELPVLATVLRSVEPALGVVLRRVAERGDVHEIGIVGVDADLADVARLGQAHVPPRDTGIGRLVDAVAVGDVDADRRFARAGVDDVAVGRRDRQALRSTPVVRKPSVTFCQY